MVCVRSFAASGPDTAVVLDAIGRRYADGGGRADFAFVFFGGRHDGAQVRTYLSALLGGTPFLGGTSHDGLMTEAGLIGPDGIGLLTIEDERGQYGTALVPQGRDAGLAARQALSVALDRAGCTGELPALVWVFQAQGNEEATIESLRSVVADRCPIAGGSAATDDDGGIPLQIGPDGVMRDGIAVAVLFPSGGIGAAFGGGYEPTGISGIVTRACDRQLCEIDGAPAAEVYDAWTDNALHGIRGSNAPLPPETALYPLGIAVGDIRGVTSYLLVSPKSVLADASMTTYATIPAGTRVHCMRGSRERLAERAGRVCTQAAGALPGGSNDLAGGIMIFCSGCQRTIRERMPAVADDVRRKFAGTPFLLGFTHGEVGPIANRGAHGNMMIAAVAFGR